MTSILSVRNLIKHYPKVQAVNGLDLDIREGICFGLLGPNGAGKTTSIEMMEGILEPTSGQVLYRNQPIGPQFRSEVGIQFQNTALQDFLTVYEVLRLFQSFYDRVLPLDEVIELCTLKDFLHRDAKKLSGGQRQRVLLALALVNDPDLIFLDEPTTGLDPQARRNFWELVRGIQKKGKTVVLTTHYMEEAFELCDEIAIMDQGKIIAQGEPEALLKKHFEGVTIQIPVNEAPELKASDLFSLRLHGDTWELRTTRVNETLRSLMDSGVALARARMHSQTLEDLFLELTGRELRV